MARRRLVAVLVAVAFALGILVGRTGDRSVTPAAPAASGIAVVTHITDGDTVSLGGIGKVRLIGIDTPEVYGRVDCFGPAASAFAKRVLRLGTSVRYRIGREAHDRYGRTLAYVWLADGRMFNELLAEDGYARPLTIAPNDDYAKVFAAASGRARAAGRGLWGRCSPR
jgi:micrococcal nuclease